jgi:hypothetical protein
MPTGPVFFALISMLEVVTGVGGHLMVDMLVTEGLFEVVFRSLTNQGRVSGTIAVRLPESYRKDKKSRSCTPVTSTLSRFTKGANTAFEMRRLPDAGGGVSAEALMGGDAEGVGVPEVVPEEVPEAVPEEVADGVADGVHVDVLDVVGEPVGVGLLVRVGLKVGEEAAEKDDALFGEEVQDGVPEGEGKGEGVGEKVSGAEGVAVGVAVGVADTAMSASSVGGDMGLRLRFAGALSWGGESHRHSSAGNAQPSSESSAMGRGSRSSLLCTSGSKSRRVAANEEEVKPPLRNVHLSATAHTSAQGDRWPTLRVTLYVPPPSSALPSMPNSCGWRYVALSGAADAYPR